MSYKYKNYIIDRLDPSEDEYTERWYIFDDKKTKVNIPDAIDDNFDSKEFCEIFIDDFL